MYLLNPLQNDAMHITINSTTALNIAIPPLVCRAFARSPQKRRYPAAHASNKGHLSSAPRCNLPRDVESPMTSASLPMRFSFERDSKRAAGPLCRLIHWLRLSWKEERCGPQHAAESVVSIFVPRDGRPSTCRPSLACRPKCAMLRASIPAWSQPAGRVRPPSK